MTRAQNEALWASIFGMLAISIICSIAVYVLSSIFMMKIFKKANQEGWKAWIPFLNTWVFMELGGYNGWLALLPLAAIIPCVGIVGAIVQLVYSIMAAAQISIKLNRSSGWAALYFFLPFVWAGILGMGNDQWDDSRGKPALTAQRPPSSAGTAPGYSNYGAPGYATSAYGAPVQQEYQQQTYQQPQDQAPQQQGQPPQYQPPQQPPAYQPQPQPPNQEPPLPPQ